MSDDLPMGWVEKSLLELTGIDGLMTDGDWIESKDQDPNGEVRLIQLADIGDGVFVNKSNRFLTVDRSKELRCTFLQEGDLLIARMPDPLGRSCLFPNINQISVTAVDVCVWRAGKEGINSKWLMYFINSPAVRNQIQSLASGTTRQRVSGGNLKKFSLPVPPLNEQRRIVDKLDRIGDRNRTARNELNHIPKLIARYKQAVLAAACSGKLTEDWHTNSLLSSKNGSVLLSEALLELKTGPFGSVLHKSDYVIDGIPIVNPMHINDGNITPSSEMTISIDKAKELSDFILKSGDVVIARRGVVGRCAVVQSKQNGWLCGTGSMILRPKPQLLPEYLQIFLSSPNTIEILTADAVGSTMVNLNQRGLLSLEIWLPSLEEQKEIVRRVEKMFEKIDMMEQEYQKAAKLCDRLEQATLAKAFRGELVPQDPDDEPASVLLEQVKREKQVQPKGKSVKSK
jgi:type I restriction enzyme S subunit